MVYLPNKAEMIEIRRNFLIFTRTFFSQFTDSKKDDLEEEDF